MTIWKYILTVRNGRQEIQMPTGSRLLTVQLQGDEITIWALVNPAMASFERRKFMVIGGNNAKDDLLGAVYCGTVQQGGYFVWHVFEVLR